MTDRELALLKAQIEVQLRELEEACRAAEEWYLDWKARQNDRH